MAENDDDSSNQDKSLFREKALLKRGAPDQLDQPFQLTQPITWIAWFTGIGVILTVFFWLFFGSIPLIMQGKGIFMNREGLFSIQAKASGSVSEILVKPGMLIEKGQLVAIIEDPQEKFKYESVLIKEKQIREGLAILKKQIKSEASAQKEALEKQIVSSQATIRELEKSITPLENDLKKKEALVEQNLLSLKDLQETRQLLTQRKIALETTRGNLENFKAELTKGYRVQELKLKERDLLQASQERELLELTRHLNMVYSPDSGNVIELLVEIGNYVNSGTPLMHLEYNTENSPEHVVYAYVPIEIGKKIKNDTKVEIEPSTVNSQEYGAIIGTVTAVSSFAVSKENLANLIQNPSLADIFIREREAVVQVTIVPLIDPSTFSGLKWTSEAGPPMKISTGTVCTVKAIIERQRPIYYFFSLQN